MDRIRLIELIEGQTARLSAEGRGLWEGLEFLRESVPDPEAPSRMAREYDIMERVFGLPLSDQFLTSRLTELILALRRAEGAERRGESGDDQRARGVINAAMLKDSEEGLPIDARMTLERAIARLEEQDQPLSGRVHGRPVLRPAGRGGTRKYAPHWTGAGPLRRAPGPPTQR